MRHRKDTKKLGRDTSHRRCLMANMLKALIENESIETTVAKAKVMRRFADKMVTLAKKNTLAARRKAIATMMISFNALTPKEARSARNGDTRAYNGDRKVIEKLFSVLGPRFATREGGYTRVVKGRRRQGDNAQTCVLQFLSE